MIGGANWARGAARAAQNGASTSGATTGVTVTAGSANVKGSWVDIGSALAFSTSLLLVNMLANSAAADYVVDIGVNVGGNRFVIAEDLRFSTGRVAANEGNQWILLPLFVVAGAQLSARCASSTGSATMQLAINTFSKGLGGSPGFSRCRALYTPGTSRGVAIDPGATANTKGAYAQIIASTAFNVAAIMFQMGANADVARATAATFNMDIAIGAAASEQIFLADYLFSFGIVATDQPMMVSPPICPFYIPSGTRISARAQCTINTAGDRTFDLAMWGFEP